MIYFADQQAVYMAMVGSFPFNSFLSGVLSCVGTAVLAGKLDILYTICKHCLQFVVPELLEHM